MDTRILKFFVAVYEQKNLTRAAEQCFVSQPNISNGIKQLEKELGKELFSRHKRGVIAKEAAHYLYPIAKRILCDLATLPDLFLHEKFKHKICIGVAQDLPQEFKSTFFKTASQNIELLEWDIRPIGRDCEINLLVREWKYEEDLFLSLWHEDYVLCIPDHHPLLEKEIIELSDLAKEDFIHCPPCEAHQQSFSILNNSGSKWNTVANCTTKTEVLTLLMAGLGITFLPEFFAKPWKGFQIKPYNGPKYYREIGFSYPKESLNNPAIAQLIALFSKV
ncbi:LysR family transcriptional regulator [Flavobacterium laiguense]|uniref:LysR family transcriptional regulator n=1 Tax=Flavobacterium laiguense TaxID=2169409 RepID=A0A2U1JZ43_9FLAO|nr:LysR family transcriptional regulator [Flavobacterium laiguense]PWA10497.1 LysR family transcriptional regulator [Flavobacterium laiguense]